MRRSFQNKPRFQRVGLVCGSLMFGHVLFGNFLFGDFLFGNVALAQGQGGRGRFGGDLRQLSSAELLAREQVQKELALTDDQTAKIKEIVKDFAPGQRGQRVAGQQLSRDERQARAEERQKKAEDAGRMATELLTAEQNARLRQVELWALGTRALTVNAEVGKQLNLTDDQKGAIKTILDESGKKRREISQGAGRGASDEDRKKAAEQATALRSETDAECLAVLTDDQKAAFEKLKGPKFELDTPAFGRNRRGAALNN